MKGEPVFDPKADSPLSDETLKGKKERYARFDSDTALARVIRDVFDTEIKSVQSLSTGSNAFDHLVYRVQITDGRSVICRINTDPTISEYFLVEAALYNAWRTAGIPSPEVFAVQLRTDSEGFDYMILESVGTTDLERLLKEDSARTASCAVRAAEFLAHIHSVSLPGFGMLTLKDTQLTGSHSSWSEAVLVRLNETLEYLVEHSLLTKDQVEAIQAAFVRHNDLLELSQGVSLHGDYHNANILFDEIKGTIPAAIDLSQAKVGDPVFDLAFYSTYVTPEVFTIFLTAYQSKAGVQVDLEKKLALYRLRIYASKAKLRKRFGYEERIPAAIEGMVQALQELA